jgi:hypothetical protein
MTASGATNGDAHGEATRRPRTGSALPPSRRWWRRAGRRPRLAGREGWIRRSGPGADLVVIGHSGLSGVWGLFLGTTAEKVSRHAACSVRIVR